MPPNPQGGTTPTLTCNQNPPTVSLSQLETRPQAGNNLCWAATAQVLTNGALKQCVSASKPFGNANHCCPNVPTDCDRVGWPPLATNGYSYSVRSRQWPTWDELKQQLGSKSGVAVTEEYRCNNNAHITTIIGTAELGDQHFAQFFDSAGLGSFIWILYPTVLASQQKLLPGEPDYVQSRAYFNVKKATSVPAAKCAAEDQFADSCNELPGALLPAATSLPALPTNDPPNGDAGAKTTAECGMHLVRELGSRDPLSMGFESPAQSAGAQLSTAPPVKIEYVHTGSGNTCSQPETNCPNCQLFFYQADGVERGGVIVGAPSGGWQVVRMGGERTATEAARLLQQDGPAGQHKVRRRLLIVPELGQRFLEVDKNKFRTLGGNEDLKKTVTLDELQAALKKIDPPPVTPPGKSIAPEKPENTNHQ